MRGDTLDLALLAVCALFAFSGFRQGLVIGVLSFVGFFGGGLLGTRLAPPVARALSGHLPTAVTGVLVVFAAASVGQLVASTVGVAVRRRMTWAGARAVDGVGGAILSVAAVLLVAWVVGTALTRSPYRALNRQVRRSEVLAVVDQAIPAALPRLLGQFYRLLDTTGVPGVFGALTPERVVPVGPPDPAVLNSAAVRADRADIVKVHGLASCDRSVEGSGFVYAAGRVMTNAHVVAGVRHVVVDVPGQGSRPATVVLYDPRRDVAVLAVDTPNRPLPFGPRAAVGTSAIVAGYPQNGPFDVQAARVRDRITANGPDIYNRQQVSRDVYALRALVRPGNSGGPLLGTGGAVLGVVFATSTDQADTGYALTAAEVASDAAAGARATAAVSTEGCD